MSLSAVHETSTSTLPALSPPSAVAVPTQGEPLLQTVHRWNRIGLFVLVFGLGGFVLWASTFNLAGGAYAGGMVRLSDEKQVVAHVEGGIIRHLLVAEGSKVTAGQDLVVLDDYSSETNLAILEKRRWELLARQARLEAQRDNLPEILFPQELMALKDKNQDVQDMLAAQTRQFVAARTDLDGQKQIIKQQTAQYRSMIDSLKSQIDAGTTQLDLIKQEADGVSELLAKGLERRPRLLALQRQQAALEGQQADYNGRIASYGEKIGENDLQIANLEADSRAKVTSDLNDLQTTLHQTEEQWSNARLRSRELTLKASTDGTVINLQYRNEGAVVPPGRPIMEIVPDTKVFVVDAKVSPHDIDMLQRLPIGPVPEDQDPPAQIRLTSLKQRTHVTMRGQIVRVSPDALVDEKSGAPYFEARVAFDTSDPEFSRLIAANEIFPGMPADVTFITQERTMLQYLWQPVSDSFYRSFHER